MMKNMRMAMAMLLLIGLSLIGAGVVSAADAGVDTIAAEGQIGKDVPPMEPSESGEDTIAAEGQIGKDVPPMGPSESGVVTIATEGQIGKDVPPMEPSATIDAVTTVYYYAYAANYVTGNWNSLTSYSYNTGVACGAGSGTYLACWTL